MVNPISFYIPSTNILKLNDNLFLLGLEKIILLVSCMKDFQCRVTFEGKQCIISYYSLPHLRNFIRGIGYGGIYKLPIDLVAFIHPTGMLGETSSFEEAYI